MRLLLWPSRRDKSRWVCVSPDEDVYEEAFLETDPLNHAIRAFGLGRRTDVPSVVTQDIYDGIFSEAPSKEDISGWLDVGRAEGQRILGQVGEQLLKEPTFFLGDGGQRLRLDTLEEIVPEGPARRVIKKAPPRPEAGSKPSAGVDESLVWVAMEKSASYAAGDVVPNNEVETSLGARGVGQKGSDEFFVYQFSEEDAKKGLKEYLRALVVSWREHAWVDEDIDARVLPILYMSGRVERRFRRWREVADVVTEEAFDDWPLEDSIRSADWLVQTISKGERGGPVDYVDSYLSRHPYQPSDRSQHELKSLAEILEAAGSYDQLNLSSLSFVELLVRRWQMIVDAHSRNPLAPNYEASDYYSGHRRGRFGIAPHLSAHVARTMKDESEIDKQRSKAKEHHPKGGHGSGGKGDGGK